MSTVFKLRKPDVALLNKVVVALYKMFGFLVLAALLLGLFSFIGLNAFFFVNRSWVSPMILSRADERVLLLSAQLAQQSTARDKLVAEHAELKARVAHAQRIVQAQEIFQAALKRAVAGNLESLGSELEKIEGLRRELTLHKGDILRSNEAYSSMSQARAQQLWSARLMDSDDFASAGYHVAQIAHSSFGLEQADVQLDTRADTLRREIRALHTVKRDIEGPAGVLPKDKESSASAQDSDLSSGALRMKEDYLRSVTELAKTRADREVAAQALAVNESSTARFDKLLESIHGSPYLKAIEANITVAFVPYRNLAGIQAGSALYGCYLGVVACRKVGTIVEFLEGEVNGRHPLRNQPERGALVRMEISERRWAEERVLFVGRRPLFF